MAFDYFKGYVPNDPSSPPTPEDVAKKQSLAKQLLGNQITAQNPLGVLANALNSFGGSNLNAAASEEATAGRTDANQQLAQALAGGPQAAYQDPSKLIGAIGNQFLPQASASMASDVYKNQADLNKPVLMSSFDSGTFTPATGQTTSFLGGGTGMDPQTIADNISSGRGSMNDLANLSKPMATAVMSLLAKSGYGTANARINFAGDQHAAVSANASPQLRLRQAESTVTNSLPLVSQLGQQWSSLNLSGPYKALNRASLEAAKQGTFGQPAATAATQIDAQISDLAAEIATIYKGGGTPTNEDLAQARTQLDGAMSNGTLNDMLGNIQRNVGIREQSTPQTPVSVTGSNPYITAPPSGPVPLAPLPATAPAIAPNIQTLLDKYK